MQSHNLALLPPDKRSQIELDKRASLLVYQLRNNQITRYHIQQEIDKLTGTERKQFIDTLAKYGK